MPRIEFDIVAVGYQCGPWIKKCYESVASQGVPYRFHVVDDASPDRFIDLLPDDDERIIKYRSEVNEGPAASRWKIFQRIKNNNSIAVQLDADDWLVPSALPTVAATYRNNPGTRLTLGQFKNLSNGRSRTVPCLSKWSLNRNTYLHRNRWMVPPLRTFDSKLLQHLKIADLKHNGQWFRAATDVAYMYSIMRFVEPKQYQPINKVLYVYNDKRGNNISRERKGQQRENFEIIRRRLMK